MEKIIEKNERQRRLNLARRVVVKIGTSIVSGVGGEISVARVEPIVRSIASFRRAGRQFVLVSSGAVGLGAGKLGFDHSRLHDVVMRQACAAVGQSLLMHAYEQLFRAHDLDIAQVLLTEDDFTDWGRYRNLRRTMEKLLKLGVVPIVNENDTVSITELAYLADSSKRVFSDNDRLAALVMSKLDANALVLLTNVDGLLQKRRSPANSREPAQDKAETVIPLVTEITPKLKALASGPSLGGKGGMLTKLEAAEIGMRAGGLVVIANGSEPRTLDRLFAGEEIGTAFVPGTRMRGKRRWIAYAASPRGRLIVNAGAREALIARKSSLLLSGVLRIENHFEEFSVVSIVDTEGREFARGIANFASAEAEKLLDRRTRDKTKNAGSVMTKAPVLITRDNIVLMEKE